MSYSSKLKYYLPLPKGSKVIYYREGLKLPQLGILKTPCRHDDQEVFVVFNCANDWENYDRYTAVLTPVEHLYFTWDLEGFPITKENEQRN